MQAQSIPAPHSVSSPSERPFKVYQFTPAGLLPGGRVLSAFWYEVAACQSENDANTICNLMRLALTQTTLAVSTSPPTTIPDSNLYDMDGNVVKPPEPLLAPKPDKPKALTPQKVHAILKAAGHQHVGRFYWSEHDRSHRWERDGFRVGGKPGKGYVTVEYVSAMRPGPDGRQVATAKCLEYKAALESAGLVITVNEWKGTINWLECRLP